MARSEHLWRVLFLVALTTGTHLLVVSQSVAPAPDSLRFIWMAQRLGTEPIAETIRSESDHPLFALLILMIHPLVALIPQLKPPEIWWASTQLVSLLASVALVPILYELSRTMLGDRVGWWSTLIFCLLPVPTRITADGLSDGLHLTFILLGITLALKGFQRRTPHWFIISGVAIGLGFWTRPEALVTGLSIGLVMIGGQLYGTLKQDWGPWCRQCIALILGCGVLVAPYVIIKGGAVTSKGSVQAMMSLETPKTHLARFGDGRSKSPAPKVSPSAPAVKPSGDRISKRLIGAIKASGEVTREYLDAGHYGLPALALWGIFAPWAPRARKPAAALALAVCFLTTGVLILLGSTTGYVASRHTLVIVALTCPWAGVFCMLFVDRVGQFTRPAFSPITAAALALALAIATVPKTNKPLHETRYGHRLAAEWISQNVDPGQALIDDHGFASFHSGLKRYSYKQLEAALEDHNTIATVVEVHDFARKDSPYRELQDFVACLGRPVASYPLRPDDSTAGVFIYHLRREEYARQSHESGTIRR